MTKPSITVTDRSFIMCAMKRDKWLTCTTVTSVDSMSSVVHLLIACTVKCSMFVGNYFCSEIHWHYTIIKTVKSSQVKTIYGPCLRINNNKNIQQKIQQKIQALKSFCSPSEVILHYFSCVSLTIAHEKTHCYKWTYININLVSSQDIHVFR